MGREGKELKVTSKTGVGVDVPHPSTLGGGRRTAMDQRTAWDTQPVSGQRKQNLISGKKERKRKRKRNVFQVACPDKIRNHFKMI